MKPINITWNEFKYCSGPEFYETYQLYKFYETNSYTTAQSYILCDFIKWNTFKYHSQTIIHMISQVFTTMEQIPKDQLLNYMLCNSLWNKFRWIYFNKKLKHVNLAHKNNGDK